MSGITDESPAQQLRREHQGGGITVLVSLLFAVGAVLLWRHDGWLAILGYLCAFWAAIGFAVGIRTLLTTYLRTS